MSAVETSEVLCSAQVSSHTAVNLQLHKHHYYYDTGRQFSLTSAEMSRIISSRLAQTGRLETEADRRHAESPERVCGAATQTEDTIKEHSINSRPS